MPCCPCCCFCALPASLSSTWLPNGCPCQHCGTGSLLPTACLPTPAPPLYSDPARLCVLCLPPSLAAEVRPPFMSTLATDRYPSGATNGSNGNGVTSASPAAMADTAAGAAQQSPQVPTGATRLSHPALELARLGRLLGRSCSRPHCHSAEMGLGACCEGRSPFCTLKATMARPLTLPCALFCQPPCRLCSLGQPPQRSGAGAAAQRGGGGGGGAHISEGERGLSWREPC